MAVERTTRERSAPRRKHRDQRSEQDDIAVNALKAWAQKNRPEDGKSILAECETVDQAAWAYTKLCQHCGCEDAAVA